MGTNVLALIWPAVCLKVSFVYMDNSTTRLCIETMYMSHSFPQDYCLGFVDDYDKMFIASETNSSI